MKRYHTLNSYFKSIYYNRVHKIVIDVGLFCPNRNGVLNSAGCIYCNNKGSGTNISRQNISIQSQININKKQIQNKFKTEKIIVYLQSFSNTYTTNNIIEQYCYEATSLNNIIGISIATRSDCINKTKLDILEYYSKKLLIWIEYGIQSSNKNTLYLINRKNDIHLFENCIKLTNSRKIKSCCHIILGLPNENRKMMLKSADFISLSGINSIKIHMLYIIENTFINFFYKKKYDNFLSKLEYTSILSSFISRTNKKIIIQRVNSDTSYEKLTLPLWTKNKKLTILLFNKILKLRKVYQDNNGKISMVKNYKLC